MLVCGGKLPPCTAISRYVEASKEVAMVELIDEFVVEVESFGSRAEAWEARLAARELRCRRLVPIILLFFKVNKENALSSAYISSICCCFEFGGDPAVAT